MIERPKDSVADNDGAASAAPRRVYILRHVPAVVWVVNIALLCGAIAWIYFDGRSGHAIYALSAQLGWHQGSEHLDFLERRERQIGRPRFVRADLKSNLPIMVTAAGAVLSLIAGLATLLFGPNAYRSLRAWLAFVALVSAWLALGRYWPELHWAGQKARVTSELSEFELVVKHLRRDWPASDDESELLGPLLVYGHRGADTLILLHRSEIPDMRTNFTAVERSESGVLRFELAGAESGVWLEWHPNGGEPASFQSGVATVYHLTRQASLGGKWYLATYEKMPTYHPSVL